MTRETKVGLLVGIGVILLIGIIISDHLTVVKNANPSKQLARFATAAQQSIFPPRNYNPPQGQSRITPDKKTQYASERQPRKILTPGEMDSPSSKALPPRAFAVDRNSNNKHSQFAAYRSGNKAKHITASYHPASLTLAGKPPRNENVPASSTNSGVIHTVQKGETLYAIADQYYHNGSYWKKIAKANADKVGANGQITVGQKLRIPDITAASSSEHKSSGATKKTASQKIKVKKGDTLAALAKHYLGSSTRWHEIIKANSDKIKDPRDLRPGMVLLIPGE